MQGLKSVLKICVPILIGLFFIYLTVNMTTAQDRELIYNYIKNADLRFVLLSLIFAILSHLSRAYRWKYLLEPLGYQPRFVNSVMAVLITYIANLGVPRSGEILRATTMSTYEKIPFEKGFGTIIAERILDIVFLLFFIGLALSLQFELIWEALMGNEPDTDKLWIYGSVFLFGFGCLLFLFKRSQHPFVQKIKHFFQGLLEGILTIKTMPGKVPFVLHTLFIWFMYFAMFYVVKWTIPETASLTLIEIIPAFVIGALTISATNGGIGIYPFSVGLMLTTFGISKEAGLAFGWIMWSGQTAIIVIFGSLAFFVLPLINKVVRQ